MSGKEMTIHVRIDKKTYKRFSYFDAYSLRKAWKQPVRFAGILLAFAVVCILINKEQSLLAGLVLALVGLGLPVVYFASYSSSIRLQAEQLRLDKPRPAYDVTIGRALHIVNTMKKEPAQELSWENVFGVWRGKEATYLYATPQKAFILPDGQSDATPEEIWTALEEKLGSAKMHRKK